MRSSKRCECIRWLDECDEVGGRSRYERLDQKDRNEPDSVSPLNDCKLPTMHILDVNMNENRDNSILCALLR